MLCGALLRVPLGHLYQALDGRRIVLMGILLSAVTPLSLPLMPATPNFSTLLVLGMFLGVGGASFAVALPMAGSAYPPRVQGLVLGLAAAGNIGAVLDGILFPPLARYYGWQTAMIAVLPFLALAALTIRFWGRDYAPKSGSVARALAGFLGSLVFLVVLVTAAYAGLLGVSGHPTVLLLPVLGLTFVLMVLPRDHRRVLREGDTWAFSLVYAVTFGGFVGMSAYTSLLLIALYHVPKVEAGLFMAALAFTGATVRPLGGYLADRVGGPRALRYGLSGIAIVDLVFALLSPLKSEGLPALFVLYVCFGLGNGATFQIVPLRWSERRGLMTGLIGAAGGIGGFYLPVVLGIAKQATSSYHGGFALFAGLAVAAATLVHNRARRWMAATETACVRPALQEVAMGGDWALRASCRASHTARGKGGSPCGI